MRSELARLGLAPVPQSIGSAKQYLLMKWRDGWQEVGGIDRDTAELLRYYVIERIEDRGRLSLDVGADYPELFVIERTPRDLTAAYARRPRPRQHRTRWIPRRSAGKASSKPGASWSS